VSEHKPKRVEGGNWLIEVSDEVLDWLAHFRDGRESFDQVISRLIDHELERREGDTSDQNKLHDLMDTAVARMLVEIDDTIQRVRWELARIERPEPVKQQIEQAIENARRGAPMDITALMGGMRHRLIGEDDEEGE
jgi:predicted CopG family antitoxin